MQGWKIEWNVSASECKLCEIKQKVSASECELCDMERRVSVNKCELERVSEVRARVGVRF